MINNTTATSLGLTALTELDSPTTPTSLATEISNRYPETIEALRSVVRHPRSLARPTAAWRPPVKNLPRLGSGPALIAAVTRRRVGPRARARIQGFGETQVPAYVVELRLSDAAAVPADRLVTEAWVRALVTEEMASTVHELPSPRVASYVWLVDGSYQPVHSPPSMFEGLTAA